MAYKSCQNLGIASSLMAPIFIQFPNGSRAVPCMELCLLHFVHPSSRMTGWGRNDQKQSFQGHFERNDDRTISHFSSLISVIRGHSDLEWPSNDKIPSFRSHSGMTWDECLFAQNISRLLGRAMEGKRNDAEWLRNDRMTQEWWKDKRTTQMTKGW